MHLNYSIPHAFGLVMIMCITAYLCACFCYLKAGTYWLRLDLQPAFQLDLKSRNALAYLIGFVGVLNFLFSAISAYLYWSADISHLENASGPVYWLAILTGVLTSVGMIFSAVALYFTLRIACSIRNGYSADAASAAPADTQSVSEALIAN